MSTDTRTLESVVVRFAGDSGDGMQLTGNQFTETSALAGNDLPTFPDYPAEIRAPAGTLAGVSGFQIHIASDRVFTPGDDIDMLVAMNPAALKANKDSVRKGGMLLLDSGSFNKKAFDRAHYESDPREDGSLEGYEVVEVDITDLTLKALDEFRLPTATAKRSKNMFALGLVYWMYGRPLDHTIQSLDQKFGNKAPAVRDANVKALKAGYHFGETHELFSNQYTVAPAQLESGHYRNISGNQALAYGLVTAAKLSGLDLFYGSYPITPASPLLHHLAKQKALGVKTFQAEDEIAACCAAIGASYAGSLAVTASSGPGIALKQEGIALALVLELPLVIVNVQRAGPGTGMPTKTEQADLFQAVHGRHGESPIPVVAAKSPGDCYWAAIDAARIALEHMTPVILLSDGYIANGAEPWKIPQVESIRPINTKFAQAKEGEEFLPYARDEKLARPWALPGTPGLEHRIGGLEKQNLTGHISYDPENHHYMSKLRQERVDKVADGYLPTEIFGETEGDLLVLSWGGTFGSTRKAVTVANENGMNIGHVHLRHLSPFPKDLGRILGNYKRVLIPEINLGQLAQLIRAEYLVDAVSMNKMTGQPYKVRKLLETFARNIEEVGS